MARSGSDISTRIGFSGSEDVKKQLENLAKVGEKALSDLQRNFSTGKDPFAGLTAGADEVKRHFDNLAASSQRSGNAIRASLVEATGATNTFVAGARGMGASSKQVSFALRDLSFQANDVATSLASGISPMRTFSQQGGQIFQAFQIAGGPRAVFGALGTAISNMISPMLLAGVAATALAVGFALLIGRAQSSEQSAKSFDVTLRALGKSNEITGKQLEEGAQSLRDVGLSADEARDHLRKALTEGVKPQDAVKVVRIGANVAAAMGEGKDGIDRFSAAAGKGGEALREYGEKLGIIPRFAKEVEAELKATADAIEETARRALEFNNIIKERNRSLADDRISQQRELDDERRHTAEEIKELTRVRGTAEEEITRSSKKRIEEMELSSSRRLIDLNRQTNRRIADLIEARNRENAKKLQEHNRQIEKYAQEAAGASLLAQIDARTKKAAEDQLTPVGKALRDLGIAWNDLLNTMSQSSIVQGAVAGLKGLVDLLREGFKNNTVTTIGLVTGGIVALGVATAVVVPLFGALVSGATAIVAGLGALASGVASVGSGLLVIAGAIGWPALLLAGVTALVASFVNWGDLLSGKTWSDFLGLVNAIWDAIKSLGAYLGDTFLTIWNTVWGGIKDGFAAVVKFFSDQINSLMTFFSNLGNSVGDALNKALSVVKAAASFLGLANGGLVPGFAAGGHINGPTGTDRVPIWATAGEYMVRKSSVDYLGIGFLNMVNRFPERLNDLLNGGRFAMGGLIDWQPAVLSDNFARGGLVESDISGGAHDRVSVDLTMPDGEVFADMLTPRDVAGKFGRYARQRSRVAIGRRPAWQA